MSVTSTAGAFKYTVKSSSTYTLTSTTSLSASKWCGHCSLPYAKCAPVGGG